jgi:hypothetical protein
MSFATLAGRKPSFVFLMVMMGVKNLIDLKNLKLKRCRRSFV